MACETRVLAHCTHHTTVCCLPMYEQHVSIDIVNNNSASVTSVKFGRQVNYPSDEGRA